MDEATSQIDTVLDDQVSRYIYQLSTSITQNVNFQIQRTIREELSHAMVITIAHRLKTVMDYDRVLVLSYGEIVEFGPPGELLENPDGVFRDMCQKSADWNIIRKM